MHDFGKLVYLDVHKTGSTFVSRFLSETCLLPEVREWKHQPVSAWRYRRSAYYFITVRHPIGQYSSLFRYGLDRRGGLYECLEKAGKSDLYRKDPGAFNQWLRFLLDHRNAPLLGEGLEAIPEAYGLGLMSYRYLTLSLLRAVRTLLKKPKRMDLVDYCRQQSIANYVIRNETLNEGLLELARSIRPQFFDQSRVNDFLSRQGKVNASTVKDDEINEIDDDVLEIIREKERVLLELYPSSVSAHPKQ